MNVDLMFDPSITFDGKFQPFSVGLKPPDFLPGVSGNDELKLLNDAYIVYATLKKFDSDFLRALHSPIDQERNVALRVNQDHQLLVDKLLQTMKEAKTNVESQTDTIQVIHSKYQKADEAFLEEQRAAGHKVPMDMRVKMRLQSFDGTQAATDVDKTVTQHADYLQMIPGSIQAENYMAHEKHGREKFPEVFVRYWREAMKMLEGNFFLIGKNVPFRPGVEEFFGLAQDAHIPVSITSANFRPLINGVVSRIPYPVHRSYAVEADDIRATDKSTILQELALEMPDNALIYIGDGESDFPAVDKEARKVVAVYFALEGRPFAEKLAREGLPFYTYKTFDDVVATLHRLGIAGSPKQGIKPPDSLPA